MTTMRFYFGDASGAEQPTLMATVEPIVIASRLQYRARNHTQSGEAEEVLIFLGGTDGIARTLRSIIKQWKEKEVRLFDDF